ncbi:MAG: efflux RND transporter permease subunit, partial [SAR324 cluster bacterium]|nr:efflux RND transporter permease subunit [SAR324 cluster bacterium]
DAFRLPGPVLVRLVQKALTGFELPEGISMRFTGENEDRKETQKFIGQAMIIAVFLILLVMIAQFNSIALPLIVITSVFMSIMGVLIGLIVHDRPFGIIMTGVGTVALAGIVVNNAIVMLDFVKQLRKQGFEAGEAMITAAAVRFRPVLLTAVTTILGLAPGIGSPNLEEGGTTRHAGPLPDEWLEALLQPRQHAAVVRETRR